MILFIIFHLFKLRKVSQKIFNQINQIKLLYYLQDQMQKQKKSDSVYQISHSHPLSYLRQPQLLNQNPNSALDITYGILYSALPTIFSFELSRFPALISIYFLGKYGSTEQFVEVGLGIIMAYILVYDIIVTVNLGFAAACINISNSEIIGLMYQKTLALNCFYCIAITPLLYLSDKILYSIFPRIDPVKQFKICEQVGIIIWGLVPSFYLSCFHDTTRNYLQAQGILSQPLIIETGSVIVQLLFSMLFIKHLNLGIMGAVWAKNVSDGLYALVLYLYIIIYQPTKQSWIEWSLLSATKNWRFFLRFVGLFVVTKYIQALAFELTCLIACAFVDIPAVGAQIYIANVIILIRLAYHGIADAVNHSIYKSLMEQQLRIAIKKLKVGIVISFAFSGIITYQLLSNKVQVLALFTNDPIVIQQLNKIFTVILVIIFIEPVHAMISCFLSSMQMNTTITKIDIVSFYFISMSVGIYLCHNWDWGLIGIWTGWLIGLIISIILMATVIVKLNLNNQTESMLEENSEFHETIVQTIRESTVENGQLSAQPHHLLKRMQKSGGYMSMKDLNSA